MKSRLWKLLSALGIVVFSAAILLLSGGAPAAKASDSADSFREGELHGVWTVTVTLVNCQTGATMGAPFSSLLTFASGGTMADATVTPAFGVGQRGDGQGVRFRTGRRTYKAKSVALMAYTTPANLPASPGFNAGSQTITQDITFKDGPDSFSSDASIQFADTTGAVYRSGCATATGQRF